MGRDRAFWLLDPLQTISTTEDPTAWLGRIVLDYRSPLAAYTPRSSSTSSVSELNQSVFLNFSNIINHITSDSFKVSLLNLLGVSYEDYKSQAHSFQIAQAQSLRIVQDRDVLAKVLDQVEVTADLEQWRFSTFRPVYFIVGVLLAKDIRYSTKSADRRGVGGDVDPVSIAGLAAGVPMPLSASVGEHHMQSRDDSTESVAQGNRVFAIEYRVLKKRLFSGRPHIETHGPKGDRAFGLGESDDHSGQEGEVVAREQIELDPESFVEAVEDEEEDEEEKKRCFVLDIDAKDSSN